MDVSEMHHGMEQKEGFEKECEAREEMEAEEAEQRRFGDCFWGIQNEVVREERCRASMAVEDKLSHEMDLHLIEIERHHRWMEEDRQAKEECRKREQEVMKENSKQYLSWFYTECTTADDILAYVWSSDIGSNLTPNTTSSGSPKLPSKQRRYNLDDIAIRACRSSGNFTMNGRLLFTMHDPQSTRVQERCGKYAIKNIDTNDCFQAAYHSTAVRASDLPDHANKVQFHRSKSAVPDPHLPARFNGIPLNCDQANSTTEILRSEHTKLNRLPTLESPVKRRSPAKRKVVRKKSPKKTSSRFRQRNQEPVESALEMDSVSSGNDETALLLRVAKLMDYDASGSVSKDEMVWALRHDREIHALATQSVLLTTFLKYPSQLDHLIDERGGEVGLEDFESFCRESYEHIVSKDKGDSALMEITVHEDSQAEAKEMEMEIAIIHQLFALIDADENGVVDLEEMERVLNATETLDIHQLIHSSQMLQPLLDQTAVTGALSKFATRDPKRITKDEFVALCSNITSFTTNGRIL